MMEKNLTIIRLLGRLREVLDQRPVEVVDYWDGDLCTIGLERDGKLVYISTWPYINDPVFNVRKSILDLPCFQR